MRALATTALLMLFTSAVLATDKPNDMVLIPAGEFTMGTDSPSAKPNERPAHRVFLDAFAIDRTEVTVREYKRCIAAGACRKITSGDSAISDEEWFATYEDDEPMREVSWPDANGYCGWVGKRLPTEAEWEKAASGPKNYLNPWGDRPFRRGDAAIGLHAYPKVGSFPSDVSGYGVADMAGSVREWVADWYDVSAYRSSPGSNPQGPPTGIRRVVRGASWQSGVKGERQKTLFATSRSANAPDIVNDVLGFRCARSVQATPR
jgi:formylglycine-generating enzyme required for sulfatase activity